ncbi:MAG: hypothetical protein AAF658_18320 [Myxococcota bacterium]
MFAFLSILTVSGCAGAVQQVYVTQSVSMDTEPKLVFLAVKDFVEDQGWSLETVSPRAGYIEALTPIRQTGSVATRDRWTFRVTATGLEATKELEAHFDSGIWSGSPYVCDTYAYAEEKQTLSDIVSILNTDRLPTMTASRAN